MPALDRVSLIRNEHARLSAEIGGLPDDVWPAPSSCAGWTNARLVAHLVFGAKLYRDSITRALQGDSGPQDPTLSLVELRAGWAAYQDGLAEASPSERLAQFVTSSDALMAVLESLQPTDLDRPAWHPIGVLTIGTFVAFRVYELALQGWDTRASLDPDAELHAEVCPFLVATARRLQPRFCHPDASVSGMCRFVVDEQTWTVRVGEGKIAEVAEGAASAPTLRTDASTWLLLVTQRRLLSDRQRRVHVEGDRDAAERVLTATSFRV